MSSGKTPQERAVEASDWIAFGEKWDPSIVKNIRKRIQREILEALAWEHLELGNDQKAREYAEEADALRNS